MEPTKTGTLQYKSSRKKKFESRYMVLKDRYLFQYKAPTVRNSHTAKKFPPFSCSISFFSEFISSNG